MDEAIKQVIEQCGDNIWNECEQYPKEDWEYEVENKSTVLGCWEWAVHQAEADQVGFETLKGKREAKKFKV